jgi:hypothetical protein
MELDKEKHEELQAAMTDVYIEMLQCGFTPPEILHGMKYFIEFSLDQAEEFGHLTDEYPTI